MVLIKTWIMSSVGKKQIVGLTGLGIAFFSLMHMSGNLLMLTSPKAYNLYGHSLVTTPFFNLVELLLLAAFLAHIGFAAQLWWSNRLARGAGPAMGAQGLKAASFASRSMILTGLLLFVFLVLHLITFKYGPHYSVIYDGVEVRDLYRLVREKFQEPIYVSWYVLCLVVLGIHLSHGVSSLFQSLGFLSARNHLLRRVSWAFAIVVAGGFILQPLILFCCGGQL